MTDDSGATILVVEDEEDVADAYESQLEPDYEVRVAYTGTDALELVDESVDVVLLDRQMPGLTGEEVLEEIREQGIDCRIIVASGVDPDFDILEMPFDEYLPKPVTEADLLDAVERQLNAADVEEPFPEFLELQSKLDVLEAEKSETELQDVEEVDRMRSRVSELEAAIYEVIDDFDEP